MPVGTTTLTEGCALLQFLFLSEVLQWRAQTTPDHVLYTLLNCRVSWPCLSQPPPSPCSLDIGRPLCVCISQPLPPTRSHGSPLRLSQSPSTHTRSQGSLFYLSQPLYPHPISGILFVFVTAPLYPHWGSDKYKRDP